MMTLSRIKHAFVENIGVKLFALFVALFIWFSASGQQSATRFYIVPLKLANMPDSLAVVGPFPTEAEVTVTGTKRELLYLSFRRIEVVVNLAAAAPGRFRQRMSSTNVVVPGGLDPRSVTITTPSSIDLSFERLVSKRVPVELTTIGSIPEGYVLLDAPDVKPAQILVRGPESDIEHLRNIATEPVDLGKVRDPFEREVGLEVDKTRFTCDPELVNVAISVGQLGERVLPNVPPTVLSDAAGLTVEVRPKAVSLTLTGVQSALDTLSSADVSVLLDLSGKPPGRYVLTPEVIVPKGVDSYTLSVESLTVFVRETQIEPHETGQ
jgi:YbbR domain-containing protein